MGMLYAGDVSGAYGDMSHGPLMELFGYASAHGTEWSPGPMAESELRSPMLASLDAGAPCSVCFWIGPGQYDFHQIVGDGYGYSEGDLFCHFNYGWGGVSDLWYNQTAKTLSLYSITYNIFPTNGGEVVTGVVRDRAGLPLPGASVSAAFTDDGTGETTVRGAVASEFGVYAVHAPRNADFSVAIFAAADGHVSATNTVYAEASESLVPTNYYRGLFDDGGESRCGNSWGNTLVVGGVQRGFDLPLADGESATLTEAQAAWLNSLGDRDAVTAALADATAPEFADAYLLNLDVTQPGWRAWRFVCEGVSVRREVDETVVTVAVRLDRGGRLAPVNGALGLYAVDLATGAEEPIAGASVDDALFAYGEVATFVFRSAGEGRLVKAAIRPASP